MSLEIIKQQLKQIGELLIQKIDKILDDLDKLSLKCPHCGAQSYYREEISKSFRCALCDYEVFD